MSQEPQKTTNQTPKKTITRAEVYNPIKNYLTTTCKYSNTITHASRPVLIDWEKLAVCIEDLSLRRETGNFQRYIQTDPVAKTKNIIKKKEMDMFWRIVGRYRCCDRDEGHMSAIHVPVAPESRYVLRVMRTTLIPNLRKELDKTAICDGLDDELSYINLMSHIIAKGQAFYNGIMQNPGVSLYLCDQYYPIYTWIQRSILLSRHL
jgi:hypothetical protein